MTAVAEKSAPPSASGLSRTLAGLNRAAEEAAIPLIAVLASAALFSVFLLVQGHSPVRFFGLMYEGAFGSWFSIQNTLLRAAPLLLTALCVALPARLGLVIIGGEGALVLGGVAAACAGVLVLGAPAPIMWFVMAVAGMLVGAFWIGLAGALRHYRGVNETISSLLLSYIGIALLNHLVEGPLKDPASLNKPSTFPIGPENMIPTIAGTSVHWGFLIGVAACIAAWLLMSRTTFGFAARMTGENVRAARLQGLPVGRLVLICCGLAGAAAGLAGALEVAAVHGSANASLIAGYGYAGILVAFLARQNPLAIIPVAILIGGVTASGGLIQRRMGLPDATILVLQGSLFVIILFSETFRGKLKLSLRPRETA